MFVPERNGCETFQSKSWLVSFKEKKKKKPKKRVIASHGLEFSLDECNLHSFHVPQSTPRVVVEWQSSREEEEEE